MIPWYGYRRAVVYSPGVSWVTLLAAMVIIPLALSALIMGLVLYAILQIVLSAIRRFEAKANATRSHLPRGRHLPGHVVGR